jgi:hypothetical protein
MSPPRNDPGKQLIDDVRWFLLEELLFQPDINMTRLDDAREALRPRLPCLIRRIDSLGAKTIEKEAIAVRKKMHSLGFLPRRRPSEKILNSVAAAKRALKAVPANARTISIYAYTDPTPRGVKTKVSDADCRNEAVGKVRVDCVLCVGRSEARRRARETNSRALEIPAGGGLDAFWRLLDRATQGRKIAKLYVFGHGSPVGMEIGGEQLKKNSEIPAAFQACRFAQNAELRFFGCSVASGRPWDPDGFLHVIGTALLCRGGSATGFQTFVKAACSSKLGLQLLDADAMPVTVRIKACDPRDTLDAFKDVLDLFIKRPVQATF